MVKDACAFSQSELGKYFEWIIMNNKVYLFVPVIVYLTIIPQVCVGYIQQARVE